MKTLGLILQNALEEICAGKKLFIPEAATQEALDDFQQIAKAISYADSEGLLEHCQFGIADFTERLTFSRVLVAGGVTELGYEFLRNYGSSNQRQKVG
ncbi:hypothetical protein [Acerihabitans arboris]|uniref:Uncharacterized protein n=1 Tax=Acerihabitans arboris TaxID=2691583 RepID=A0A845SG99_9GAMM|nr:hypothetical protein [Acerihabitans arboris]NDL61974.1 hypothetical protein [Acerihabitans arboris]